MRLAFLYKYIDFTVDENTGNDTSHNTYIY